MGSVRTPDFVIIGAMKSGTTAVFRWLSSHPDCRLPRKELNFFQREENFARGPAHYLRNFSDVPAELRTGDVSPGYGDPRVAAKVAGRLGALAPGVRLIYLLRDPEDRLRSNYLHRWRSGRDRRPFVEAVVDPDAEYVPRSCYADVARPYVDAFGADAIQLVHFADLVEPTGPGWRELTDFLALAPRPGEQRRTREPDSVCAVGQQPVRRASCGSSARLGRSECCRHPSATRVASSR